jgi:hypothetical protein
MAAYTSCLRPQSTRYTTRLASTHINKHLTKNGGKKKTGEDDFGFGYLDGKEWEQVLSLLAYSYSSTDADR